MLSAKYARENMIPYLGICLGMQIAVIKYDRSILGLQDGNSTEFDPTPTVLGVQKRIGDIPCVLDQEERIFKSKILNLQNCMM
ncbi:uncharacterized protein LOC107001772 [Solanum pennellii]|uniref:CTP synthase (glutamine hydrolyzing) n=1 Tax=Solanum pennellii TaxID=28526 RepID=A0ABM1VAT2_SOLPN|nr:uncharacterized protein LOC107001772 [Solanum pennellii]